MVRKQLRALAAFLAPDSHPSLNPMDPLVEAPRWPVAFALLDSGRYGLLLRSPDTHRSGGGLLLCLTPVARPRLRAFLASGP